MRRSFVSVKGRTEGTKDEGRREAARRRRRRDELEGRGTKFGERRKRGTMENFNFTFHLKSSTFVVRRDSLRGRTGGMRNKRLFPIPVSLVAPPPLFHGFN